MPIERTGRSARDAATAAIRTHKAAFLGDSDGLEDAVYQLLLDLKSLLKHRGCNIGRLLAQPDLGGCSDCMSQYRGLPNEATLHAYEWITECPRRRKECLNHARLEYDRATMGPHEEDILTSEFERSVDSLGRMIRRSLERRRRQGDSDPRLTAAALSNVYWYEIAWLISCEALWDGYE